MRKVILARLAALSVMAGFALVVPQLWCGREARALFDGHVDVHKPLADSVATWINEGVNLDDFQTGSARFDGEWLFGTHLMAGIGFSQFVGDISNADRKYVTVIQTCIDQLTDERLRTFDTVAWGEDALGTLEGNNGHAAYLGYLNVLLGLYRARTKDDTYNELNNQISTALLRRVDNSPTGLIETYPRESYPVDNMAVAVSIALNQKATTPNNASWFNNWRDGFDARFRDRASGLIYQAVNRASGMPLDKPRASGTALAAYLVSFVDKDYSGQLFRSLKESCRASWLGFGIIKEYPDSVPSGRGDIDSGPVLFGASISGTGFTISLSRIHGDAELYRDLYRTAYLVGTPVWHGKTRTFVVGGPLGNAIMLAMLTAGGLDDSGSNS